MSDIDPAALYRHARLRECIVEHLFVGSALSRLWQLGITDVEVLRSEVDTGCDLVLSYQKIDRHIQLKTMKIGGKAKQVKISLSLTQKPSGCVIWIMVDQALKPHSFLCAAVSPASRSATSQAYV